MTRTALALALLALVPGAASARTVIRVGGALGAGPVLAGDAVVFASRDPDVLVDPRTRVRQPFRVRLASANRTTELGVAQRADESSGEADLQLAASPSRVAVELAPTVLQGKYQTPFPGRRSVLSGPLDGPVGERFGCPDEDAAGIAVADDSVVSVACGGRDVQVDGVTVARVVSELAISRVAAAGTFIAWQADRSLSVARRTGQVIYRVTLPDDIDPVGQRVEWALQADGKVAVVSANAEDCTERTSRAAWYSPREPRAHRLPARPCRPGVALAGDRILYRPAVRGVPVLALSDLTGRALSRVGTMASADAVIGGGIGEQRPAFALSKTQVAYAVLTCAGEQIVIDRLAEDALDPARDPRGCPVRFAPTAALDPAGFFSLSISCPAGCIGVSADPPDAVSAGVASFAGVAPGATAAARLHVPSRIGRLVRRSGSLDVTFRVLAGRPDGGGAVRSVIVRLLPPPVRRLTATRRPRLRTFAPR